jgi:hypothetical protein
MLRLISPTKIVVRVKLTQPAIDLCKRQGEEADRNLSQQIEHLINNNED